MVKNHYFWGFETKNMLRHLGVNNNDNTGIAVLLVYILFTLDNMSWFLEAEDQVYCVSN